LWTNQPQPFPPLSPLQQTMWAFNVACLELFLPEQIGWLVCAYNEAGQQDKTKQPSQVHAHMCVCVCVCVHLCFVVSTRCVMNFQKANNNWGKVRNMACPPTNLILRKSKFSLSLSLSLSLSFAPQEMEYIIYD